MAMLLALALTRKACMASQTPTPYPLKNYSLTHIPACISRRSRFASPCPVCLACAPVQHWCCVQYSCQHTPAVCIVPNRSLCGLLTDPVRFLSLPSCQTVPLALVPPTNCHHHMSFCMLNVAADIALNVLQLAFQLSTTPAMVLVAQKHHQQSQHESRVCFSLETP